MDETRHIRSKVTVAALACQATAWQGCKLLLLLFVSFSAASSETRARDIAAAIDQAARAAVTAGETPGLQVAVFKNGAPLLVKSYGQASLELSVAVGDDSVFRIGSITKQFVAAALLQLQEQGKVSVDDRLARFYPDFPRAADISLAQILHHTSGLHDYTQEETFHGQNERLTLTTEEWVQRFARMPRTQDFEPGTGWSYSNTGYYLLGGIIEKLEGKPLAAVLEQRFFKPLGMTRTAVDDEKDVVPGRVAGYGADARGNFTNAEFISLAAAGGAGAVRSTASDLMRWNSALFGGRILEPASLQAMITPGRLRDGRLSSTAISGQHLEGGEYGYGLVIAKLEGHEWIGHAGGIQGFSSLLAEFPSEKISLAILANSLGTDKGAGKVANRIRRIVIGADPE